MKRLSVILLVVSLLFSSAYAADVDLSALSFADLLSLQKQISIELTTRPEWKEVSVPPGIYDIGVDIPAGEWCIKCSPTSKDVIVKYGSKLKPTGVEIEPFSISLLEFLYSDPDETEKGFINANLSDNHYLQITNGTVIFTAPQRPTLGF